MASWLSVPGPRTARSCRHDSNVGPGEDGRVPGDPQDEQACRDPTRPAPRQSAPSAMSGNCHRRSHPYARAGVVTGGTPGNHNDPSDWWPPTVLSPATSAPVAAMCASPTWSPVTERDAARLKVELRIAESARLRFPQAGKLVARRSSPPAPCRGPGIESRCPQLLGLSVVVSRGLRPRRRMRRSSSPRGWSPGPTSSWQPGPARHRHTNRSCSAQGG